VQVCVCVCVCVCVYSFTSWLTVYWWVRWRADKVLSLFCSSREHVCVSVEGVSAVCFGRGNLHLQSRDFVSHTAMLIRPHTLNSSPPCNNMKKNWAVETSVDSQC
jgi:hypothetical protein